MILFLGCDKTIYPSHLSRVTRCKRTTLDLSYEPLIVQDDNSGKGIQPALRSSLIYIRVVPQWLGKVRPDELPVGVYEACVGDRGAHAVLVVRVHGEALQQIDDKE